MSAGWGVRGLPAREGVMSEVTQGELNGPIAVRKWIGDVSADRVGQVWRAEDHEALLRTMRAADEPHARARSARSTRGARSWFGNERKDESRWNPIDG